MQQLTLYRRDACLLCALAEALLRDEDMPYVTRDVESDSDLEARYGVRIPVVARADGAELGWPFDVVALRAFAAAADAGRSRGHPTG